MSVVPPETETLGERAASSNRPPRLRTLSSPVLVTVNAHFVFHPPHSPVKVVLPVPSLTMRPDRQCRLCSGWIDTLLVVVVSVAAKLVA